MLDDRIRPVKDRLLGPLARLLAPRVHPDVLSLAGMLAGLGAAAFVIRGSFGLALVCWAACRVIDGVDGVVARMGRPTAFGGYLDLMLDGLVYVAVPLAFGIHLGTTAGWVVVACLLGSFYLNGMSWSLLSAFLARRSPPPSGSDPGIPMPRGLVEGTETVVLYTLALVVPGIALWVFSLMAILVIFTAVERIVQAKRILGAD